MFVGLQLLLFGMTDNLSQSFHAGFFCRGTEFFFAIPLWFMFTKSPLSPWQHTLTGSVFEQVLQLFSLNEVYQTVILCCRQWHFWILHAKGRGARQLHITSLSCSFFECLKNPLMLFGTRSTPSSEDDHPVMITARKVFLTIDEPTSTNILCFPNMTDLTCSGAHALSPFRWEHWIPLNHCAACFDTLDKDHEQHCRIRRILVHLDVLTIKCEIFDVNQFPIPLTHLRRLNLQSVANMSVRWLSCPNLQHLTIREIHVLVLKCTLLALASGGTLNQLKTLEITALCVWPSAALGVTLAFLPPSLNTLHVGFSSPGVVWGSGLAHLTNLTSLIFNGVPLLPSHAQWSTTA